MFARPHFHLCLKICFVPVPTVYPTTVAMWQRWPPTRETHGDYRSSLIALVLLALTTGARCAAERRESGGEAIAAFGRLIPPGGNGILAVTDEVTTDPLEQFAAGLGGKVSRRPLDEVLAELEAQDEAAREADKAARKAIREQKKQERKEDFQTRVDALKAKFHKDKEE